MIHHALRRLTLLLALCLFSLPVLAETPDYADAANWAYAETDVTGKDADVFFVDPTVFLGSEGVYLWEDLNDEKTRASFVGAINMEKGIYDDNARFFSPFYHQASFQAYLAGDVAAPAFETAYAEVKAAFDYYMAHENNGRPLVLAGFSQGAQHVLHLVEDYAGTEAFDAVFVACYAIGWRFTEEDAAAHPNVRFTEGETDTGTVIAFNSEAPEIAESLLIPAGVKTYAVNPLNWRTDGTPADRSENPGACFTNYSGEIKTEIPQLTGCYIDPVRGALKVTDVSPADYPGALFPDGVYHLYDYQFFYRSLEQNVQKRIAAFLAKN
ncbi:MAG: DUF3089 domain-containing protein [Clostridia bacterium]|nr:DUF3089 domain-containing protein [Clostridia bacterium]